MNGIRTPAHVTRAFAEPFALRDLLAAFEVVVGGDGGLRDIGTLSLGT
jgi:hypothetical protein